MRFKVGDDNEGEKGKKKIEKRLIFFNFLGGFSWMYDTKVGLTDR